jgi:hypothetical protein
LTLVGSEDAMSRSVDAARSLARVARNKVEGFFTDLVDAGADDSPGEAMSAGALVRRTLITGEQLLEATCNKIDAQLEAAGSPQLRDLFGLLRDFVESTSKRDGPPRPTPETTSPNGTGAFEPSEPASRSTN